ncbi:serine/threonine-protein kinase [Actinacidiphila sp. ITFR-21]|uniref:serine/threonine-protein kinase n=1 Tax=Actinacidiphila sp. ITFR-21 TaxID=3075199 RepID=UPI00288A844E|nr:protein kinase [Streptomyces sp. ITFR-21]WNI14593.1 protein kinase [Streptomyces sp. ITFR-21]
MESLGDADPRSVGGYPLFARLGAGGMGQVYLARTPAGRALALKTVRSEFGLDPAFGERFAREIRHADRVRSPWTVAVVDFSPAGTSPQWLATEYVAAPSLAEWVGGHGPLPEASLTALAAELCEGLQAVHQAGLAHRDVKPSNVLLPGTRPLLIDFGIARAAEDSRHTRTGGVIGSPGYMAPEQATAGVSAEPGDVFALGALLVYAATGRGPFHRFGEEPSAPALLYRVVHEEPDLAGVPAAVLPLVRACLVKEPGERPTARAAAGLLPEADRAAGGWAARRPPELAAELRALEAEMKAALGEAPAAGAERPAATAPLTAPTGSTSRSAAGTALGPSPYAPAGTRPAAAYHPAYQSGTAAPLRRPNGGGWGAAPRPAPQPAPQPRPRPAGVGRKVPLVAAAVGAAVVLVLAGLLIRHLRHPGTGDDAASGGGSGTPSTSAPASGGTDADALPASWVGTWLGNGPGDPQGSLLSPRTDSFKVTLTLRAGRRGEIVGQQVSDVHDVDTGANDGCTESLELSQVNGDTMVFAARSPHPTDPSATDSCPTGNSYTVTMVGGVLRLDPGSQSAGSPSTFAKL